MNIWYWYSLKHALVVVEHFDKINISKVKRFVLPDQITKVLLLLCLYKEITLKCFIVNETISVRPLEVFIFITLLTTCKVNIPHTYLSLCTVLKNYAIQNVEENFSNVLGGAGGKGTWGKLVEVYDEGPAKDCNDPNYDSEEVGILSYKKYTPLLYL